jgi:hypothetical protein
VAVLACASALFVSVGAPALADDPLGGAVEETEGALDDTVANTTEAVGDSVDAVAEVVADPADTDDAVEVAVEDVVTDVAAGAGDAVAGAGDAVAGAGDAVADVGNAIDDAKGSTNDSVGAVGHTGDEDGADPTAPPPDGSTVDSPAEGAERKRAHASAANRSERKPAVADREWVLWDPEDRLESTWANVSADRQVRPVGRRPAQEDPCEDDPSLVCLGVLYDTGRDVGGFTDVLGVVAATGLGVMGLLVLALALATSGSTALVAGAPSLRRTGPPEGEPMTPSGRSPSKIRDRTLDWIESYALALTIVGIVLVIVSAVAILLTATAHESKQRTLASPHVEASTPPERPRVEVGEYVSRTHGYAFTYPPTWSISEHDELTRLESPSGRVRLLFGIGTSGPLDVTSRRLFGSLSDVTSNERLVGATSERIDGSRSVLVSGTAIDDAGRAVRFLAITVRGEPKNYAISILVPRRSDPDRILPQIEEIVSSFDVLSSGVNSA